jgi:hypothetical protein
VYGAKERDAGWHGGIVEQISDIRGQGPGFEVLVICDEF